MEESADTVKSFQYWTFISYSQFDESWAKWIHKALETYRLPLAIAGKIIGEEVAPKYLKPVFRDRDELGGGSDLGAKLRKALEQSRSMVVICSAKSAHSKWVEEEIRYFKSLGRADRVMCLIVSGEPCSGDTATECFPKAIRYKLGDHGQISENPADPLAADVRPGKDGRKSALIKLIAGILDIDFDTLNQRDRRRRKIQMIHRIIAVFCGFAISGFGYVLLADEGVLLPGRSAIQLALDRQEWSIVRAPASDDDVSNTARKLRKLLSLWIRKARDERGWINNSLRGDGGLNIYNDYISQAQAMAAVCRMHDLSDWDADQLLKSIHSAFVPEDGSIFHGIYVRQSKTSPPPEVTGAAWSVSLLSRALCLGMHISQNDREIFKKNLRIAQEALLPYFKDGGWTMFPGSEQSAPPDSYSTVLVLQALLDCKNAGQPWMGNMERRDELIKQAVDWLQSGYERNHKIPGWPGIGENAYEIFDGLTLQIYGVLLRAKLEAGHEIPPQMMELMDRHLISCVDRSATFPVSSGEFSSFVMWFGEETRRNEAYRFLWFPWALDAMSIWLEHAALYPQPKENVVRIRRARAHLVMNVGPLLVAQMERDWTFIAAETLYGLSSVPDQ